MIYVTVGNHDQPFERLITAMDSLVRKLEARATMQIGVSGHATVYAKSRNFFSYDEAEEFIKKADIVVAHAGIGTLISARRWGTPLIICPRRKMYGEHFNDHQMEICSEFIKNPRQGVEVALETDEIEQKILRFQETDCVKIPLNPHDHARELKNGLRNFLSSL